MADQTGYPLPENHLPEGVECMTVLIPDDPLYRWAFIGAYEHFTKWVAWERDGTTRGAEAAALWNELFLQTLENEFMPCVEIVNNINGGCGCGGGDSSKPNVSVTINNNTTLWGPEPSNENIYVDDGTNSPPSDYISDYPTWQAFNEQKCKAANFYASNLIRQINVLRTILDGFTGTTIERIVIAFQLALSDGPAPFMDTAALTIFVAPLFAKWILSKSGDVSEMVGWINSITKCDLVDIIYRSETRGGMNVAMSDYLKGKAAGFGTSPLFAEAISAYIDFAFTNRFSNWVFDNLDTLVPSDTVIECSCTESVETGPMSFTFDDDLMGWSPSAATDPAFSGPSVGSDFTLYHSASQGNLGAGAVGMDSQNGIMFYGMSYDGWGPIVSSSTEVNCDFNVTLNSSFGTGGRITVVFADGTFSSGSSQNSLGATYRSLSWQAQPSDIGKQIARVEIIMSRNASSGQVVFNVDDVNFVP